MSGKLPPFFTPDQDVKAAEAIRVVNRVYSRELQDDSALMRHGALHHCRVRLTVGTLQEDLPQAVKPRRKIGENLGRHFSPAALWLDDACNCHELLWPVSYHALCLGLSTQEAL